MSSALRPLEMLRYRQHPQHQKKKNPPTAASSHLHQISGSLDHGQTPGRDRTYPKRRLTHLGLPFLSEARPFAVLQKKPQAATSRKQAPQVRHRMASEQGFRPQTHSSLTFQTENSHRVLTDPHWCVPPWWMSSSRHHHPPQQSGSLSDPDRSCRSSRNSSPIEWPFQNLVKIPHHGFERSMKTLCQKSLISMRRENPLLLGQYSCQSMRSQYPYSRL